MEDLFVFAPSSEDKSDTANNHEKIKWKILVVDDEPEVHKITSLVLDSFVFEGKAVDLIHAYSAEEAKTILSSLPGNDIAIALIDVVMESDTAGLDLVKYIREQMNNYITRIILRTGQPGQAPEESIIKDYDINDYKAKTELTASKLKTALYASLRSYRDLISIEQHRNGLQNVLAAIAKTATETTLQSLTSQILSQIANVLDLEENAMYCSVLSKPSPSDQEEFKLKVLAKTGKLFSDITEETQCNLPDDIKDLLNRAYQEKRSIQNNTDYVSYISALDTDEGLFFVRKQPNLTQLNIDLLEIFIDHFVKAYSALTLKDEIQKSQRELVYILGEAVEMRSKETSSHVKRVGNISYILAKAYALSQLDCELIKLAAPLHDVGKVSIPDSILNKPGKLTPEERAIMESHAESGYKMLILSSTKTLKKAAIIALEHHEHWDGNGYPHGKAGEAIDVMARITGIADVYDALGSNRCYKDAWSTEEILTFLQSRKGTQFEPKLVDLLVKNIDEIRKIRQIYPDET